MSTGPGRFFKFRPGPARRAGLGRAERFYNSLEIRAGFLQSFTRTIKVTVIVLSCIVLPNFTHRKSETYCTRTRTLHINSVVSLMLFVTRVSKASQNTKLDLSLEQPLTVNKKKLTKLVKS